MEYKGERLVFYRYIGIFVLSIVPIGIGVYFLLLTRNSYQKVDGGRIDSSVISQPKGSSVENSTVDTITQEGDRSKQIIQKTHQENHQTFSVPKSESKAVIDMDLTKQSTPLPRKVELFLKISEGHTIEHINVDLYFSREDHIRERNKLPLDSFSFFGQYSENKPIIIRLPEGLDKLFNRSDFSGHMYIILDPITRSGEKPQITVRSYSFR